MLCKGQAATVHWRLQGCVVKLHYGLADSLCKSDFFTEIMELVLSLAQSRGSCRASNRKKYLAQRRLTFLHPLSSRLPGTNGSHALICMVFQVCYLNTGLLHYTLSLAPARDFHPRPQSHNYSTSCSNRKLTQKNTQKEGEKVCSQRSLYRLRQTAERILPFRYKGSHIVFDSS